jgi:mannose-1-phosphate guanylyltransferase / mannose-6-phosphate isomerase
MSVYPVILCGGSGSRLWPASRGERPKQFIPLVGRHSSFQDTVLRVVAIRGANEPVILAGRRHAQAIEDQLAEIGMTANVLLEPEGRDSGPAIAAACAWIALRDPGGLAVIVSSDHHIPDAAAFQEAANRALLLAEKGWIVTLGVRPTEPSTAFGYIKPSGQVLPGAIAQIVESFVEKPDAATAAGYIERGYLWNSGNLVAAASTLLGELEHHAANVARAARSAVAGGQLLRPGLISLGASFCASPKISIDYAVMEKTDRAAVAPAEFAWADVGAWDAVKAISPADADANVVSGDVRLIETSNCLARTVEGVSLGLIGVSDLAVVVEPGAVLVTSLAHSQKVKALAEGFGAQKPARPTAPDGLARHAERFQQWMDASALPLWWSLGADHDGGGFHECLDQAGRPIGADRRARVQARQIFVYASAGAAGWPGPWRAASEHGYRYLQAHFRRGDSLYRARVSPTAEVVDDTALLYDQAFVLLAMATLYGLDRDRSDLIFSAGALLDRIRAGFAHPAGGFAEASEQAFQSNPIMHLLESALAWIEAGGGEVWESLAREIADLAVGRMIDARTGAMREYFEADWTAAKGPAGKVIWPGHQFEWAWLLDRWGRRSGDRRARAAAVKLYAVGASGVDAQRSVAIDAMHEAQIVDARARLWPQTERVKAALGLMVGAPPEGAEAFALDASDAARGLWGYLETPVAGLWRDRGLPGGGHVEEPAPASSLYHIIGAVQALTSAAARGEFAATGAAWAPAQSA